jgi:hypothetical protein
MTLTELSKGFILEEYGKTKGGQHHNGPIYYPAKITHPDFPDIVIQVGGEHCTTLTAMNIAKHLFVLAIEEVYKVRIEHS